MTHPLKPTNCIAVEVPEDARPIELTYDGSKLVVWTDGFYEVELPGTYTLIGVWPEITEEQAREVVDKPSVIGNYYDYYLRQFVFSTAKGSVLGLLHFNSLDTSKRWAIVKPV
jgi:hypothetical protein